MEIFARSDEELARLMPEPETDANFARNLARTYLIGNGNCGALTHENLLYEVTDTLDY